MNFRLVSDPDFILRGSMRLRAYEKVVHPVECLAVIELRHCHGDFADRAAAGEYFRNYLQQIGHCEWQESTFPAIRIRIHAYHGLTAQVFEGICYQAVLAENHDGIV